ncbi:hypothetical protein LPJ66_006069 [Kickxella alabastrina]|uniref:Uncharacterized protein n=1 Tax=Kickxella alabastrina TaxID=61397 RepID=A0ACC1IIT8_9FUNG|nr:hypothetical protein LPJ66_006069 [Kickxella alabastrina]
MEGDNIHFENIIRSRSQSFDSIDSIGSSNDSDSSTSDIKIKINNIQVDENDLYDENADNVDSEWVERQHPGTTDAVLSCPMCFTQICFVCQHHTRYEGQFRALSVEHCRVLDDQIYVYGRRGLEAILATVAEEKKKEDLYRLVVCGECETKVGVVDSEDIYHLFHVLTQV